MLYYKSINIKNINRLIGKKLYYNVNKMIKYKIV